MNNLKYSYDDILANWNNFHWEGWHSASYFKTKDISPNDDQYLRENILIALPKPQEKFDLCEATTYYKDSTWWKKHIQDVIYVIDHSYIKKSVNKKSGVYQNWFTRFVQWYNTFIVEQATAKAFDWHWDKQAHSYLHIGHATAEEVLPDFISSKNGASIELKVCQDFNTVKHYQTKLKTDKTNTIRYDFHNADVAFFAVKGSVLTYYWIDLKKDPNFGLKKHSKTVTISNIILTKNGKVINSTDFPPVPYPLLFGLTPGWRK